jgi:hypothetical protein
MNGIRVLGFLALAGTAGCSAAPPEATPVACPAPIAAPSGPTTPADSPAFCMTSEQMAPRNTDTFQCGETVLTVFDWPTDINHLAKGIHFRRDDKLVAPSIFHTGSFKSLCSQDRFVLISDDVHFETGPSFLMRGNGTMVAKFDFSWSPFVTASDDHRIFWIETHEGNGEKETRLQVFDTDGKQLLDRRYSTMNETAEVMSGGKTYQIKVKNPDLPG